jgi:mRNA-degrading endonuclease RelE of RelBE toxin-antitoxin system
MRRAVFAPAAMRDLERLDAAVRTRVVKAVRRLADSGRGDLKALHGDLAGRFRLRVGEWRVFLGAFGQTGEIEVLRVIHRSDAYR